MKEKNKHIVFLPAWYPNRYDQMWGLFVKKHAEAVSFSNKVSVFYLFPVDKGLKREEWITDSNEFFDSLYIYYPKPKNKILYFFHFLSYFFKGMKKIKNNQKIDLIHVHILTRMGILAYIYSKIYTVPYVITEHWSRYLENVNTYKGWFRKKLSKIVVRNSKAVMPVTQNLSMAMQKHGLNNREYQIVPNVVDPLFFNSNICPDISIKRIIHVSTFEDKSKNISGIINAIESLSKGRNDFKMIFIGDGLDFKKMLLKVKKLKLENRIEFTGLLEQEALVSEYEKAAFMLINSKYENMPVVINEAFAVGLPVLSTNVGGISEHLNNDRGRLIKSDSPIQLEEQINWMLDHYYKFDSIQIKRYAENHFSMKAVNKLLDEVYQKALSN